MFAQPGQEAAAFRCAEGAPGLPGGRKAASGVVEAVVQVGWAGKKGIAQRQSANGMRVAGRVAQGEAGSPGAACDRPAGDGEGLPDAFQIFDQGFGGVGDATPGGFAAPCAALVGEDEAGGLKRAEGGEAGAGTAARAAVEHEQGGAGRSAVFGNPEPVAVVPFKVAGARGGGLVGVHRGILSSRW